MGFMDPAPYRIEKKWNAYILGLVGILTSQHKKSGLYSGRFGEYFYLSLRNSCRLKQRDGYNRVSVQ
jgi:hypothetical protein